VPSRARGGVWSIGRILLITSRLLARRTAATELGRRLSAAGHDVELAGPPIASAAADAHGLRFAELPDFDLGGPKASAGFASSRARGDAAAGSLGAGAVRDLLGQRQPDLVLIDNELHPHIIVARGLGLRMALFTTMFPGRPGLRAPPPDTGIVPGRGARGSRPSVGAAWVAAWGRAEMARLRDHRRGGGYRALLGALARAEGVDLRRETTRWQWQRPFRWHRLPLLLLQPRELDLPQPPDRGLRYVGHMFDREPDAPASPDDASLLEAAGQARRSGKRLVYVAFGSMFSAPDDVVVRLWCVAKALEGWHFIHALGRSAASSIACEPPANVRVVSWAPQRALLRLADVAVTHAGTNSVVECVEAGTPMLCIPLGIDHPGNAARVVFHGVGLAAGRNASEQVLADSLARLVTEPGFRARCEALRPAMTRYEHERIAEREVARLLAGAP